ncbi:1,4-dihydroxy-2-naphthoate octaprenyltransferase [Christiangramia flava]|uniref:1,4-dihydroxy-2-naphthoate octaprenyltransferase n=1 Tax=Christiangramia flava JLT2011 TaxID=1229726 RepID=A0A1L7I6L4_9FLAO|nr:1,4-dihydroxy-2-naphthoate octaprenyltransferase [Christiangramia flava]APU69226.1 1,4-dihydroxy-2-naphthoate octaprenyltransferase [Christiangramia flava JLT2011]OSS38874.1 1,4-dihydroxy-2-naphthoate octaprenyltransferase [Christiangramia flava JLT2011]
MSKISNWIGAARLRTLPLSISGILVGSSVAAHQGYFNISIFSLALGTTLGLQVLSNFANDYGDGVKGTDNEDRIGPMRAIQSGLISHREMKQAMVLTALVTFLLAVLLIYASFGVEKWLEALIFLILGIASIVAAIKYTVGNSAYGYRGMGDIFVFLFFGLVAVYGSYFLYSHQHDWVSFFPAVSIGLLSAAVLNVNNMRDRVPDAKAGKITLAVKLGEARVKNYHYMLILGSLLFLLLYSAMKAEDLNDFIYLFGFIPLIFHLRRVVKNDNPMLLDPELKIVALSTFGISILFAIGLLW